MSTDIFFQVVLVLAALLCALVAGLVLAFAVVVMPGIKHLDDREFIRAFQRIDGIVQNNQPIFVFVWVGSIAAVLAAATLGFSQLAGSQRLLLISAAIVYIFGVQLSTFTINVPLNNQLQILQVDEMDEPALKAARRTFEPRWNPWNISRTVFATGTATLLLVLLVQL